MYMIYISTKKKNICILLNIPMFIYMHDMHTYPHQVWKFLQISFLPPGGGRSWITTSAEWPVGTAMAQNFTNPRNHPKDPIRRDYSYSHVGSTVIIYPFPRGRREMIFGMNTRERGVFSQLRQLACVQQSRCRLPRLPWDSKIKVSMSLGSLGSYQIVR